MLLGYNFHYKTIGWEKEMQTILGPISFLNRLEGVSFFTSLENSLFYVSFPNTELEFDFILLLLCSLKI